MENLLNKILGYAQEYGIKIAVGVLSLIIGLWIIGMITKRLKKVIAKSKIDETLQPFLLSATNIILKILLILSILNTFGIQTTSFIAILGAAGLAVGMALSGTLQNFAGGVMLLIFKPYKVGDVIEAQGFIGSVHAIQIFNTILKSADNKTIIIPNSAVSSSSLVNYSTEPTRRLEWTFGIAYSDNLQQAESILNDIISKEERILNDPEPFIALKELADSSVNIVVRGWVKSEDYWGVHFDINKIVYLTFTEQGINIPFPQMDVHLQQS